MEVSRAIIETTGTGDESMDGLGFGLGVPFPNKLGVLHCKHALDAMGRC